MSKQTEKYSKRGIRNSNISTVIGISLVLFMIGIVLGGVLGIQDIQKQAKEALEEATKIAETLRYQKG